MRSLKRQRGISMIEVLVTAIVLGIGLLGSVKMQMISVTSNTDAAQRNLVTALMNDYVERIRINGSAAAGAYADNTFDYTAVDCTNPPATLCWTSSSGTAADCNGAQMVAVDAWRWTCAARSALGNNALTPSLSWDGATYSFSVTWPRERIVVGDQDAASGNNSVSMAFGL